MRPIDADALIIELQKDEALFDNEAIVARENSIKYTDNYAKIMWSRANGIRDAIAEVYDAPTIDADRPQGKWIIETDTNGNTYGRCSVCGMRQYAGQLNFCPDCGARMKGANNETEMS